MFTGIIEEIGRIIQIEEGAESFTLTIGASIVLDGTKSGESIAVNGTCLTVTELLGGAFTVGLAPETLSRTNLGSLVVGDGVNLERSLTPTSRMGGHFVQGHIDCTGTILSTRPDDDSLWLEIGCDPSQMRYVVPKGFIAIDGISLTVVEALDDRFTFMLVAYTQDHVTLGRKRPGDAVNVEVDILAKYAESVLRPDSIPHY
jgi:riboflavin synthase